MKKITLLFLLLQYISTVIAQPTLTPKWRTDFIEPLLIGNGNKPGNVIPIKILTKGNDTYVFNTLRLGWQLMKLNVDNGQILWKSSRNYKTPMLDSAQYFGSTALFDRKGNIEILGTRTGIQYPKSPSLPWGGIAKSVYDSETGVEIFYKDYRKEQTEYRFWGTGGILNRFSNNSSGTHYYIFDGAAAGDIRWTLRKMNVTKFDKIDTLQAFSAQDLEVKEIRKVSDLNTVGNALYGLITYSEFNSDIDSSLSRLQLVKMDTTGKILSNKYIQKVIYNNYSILNIINTKDGFILVGQADSTYQSFNKDFTNFALYMTKIDLEGNVKWRYWFNPTKEYYFAFGKIDENNYYVSAASASDSININFYQLNHVTGKLKKIAKINSSSAIRDAIPTRLSVLPSKDIILHYQYWDCLKSKGDKDSSCFGLALISKADIEKVTAVKEKETLRQYKVSVYPIPTEKSVRVVLDEAIQVQYNLYDLNGKILWSENSISDSQQEIDLSNFSKGIYFLNVVFEDGMVVNRKILKY